MPSSLLPYETWVEDALRSVVRKALEYTVEHGLIAPHHFYVTFTTDDPDVDLPDWLRAQYPEVMTIVLQHQFWDLEVNEEAFSVSLRFHGRAADLRVPFAAVQAFGDPGVNFGLQLHALPSQAEDGGASDAAVTDLPPPTPAPAEPAGEVIALDSFRKK